MSEELKKTQSDDAFNDSMFVVPDDNIDNQPAKDFSDVQENNLNSDEDFYKKELIKEQNRSGYEQRKKSSPEDVDKLVDQKLEAFKAEMRAQEETKFLDTVSSNQNERDLIKFHLENTIKRSGDIAKDVEMAKLLANREKIQQVISEIPAMRSATNVGIRSSGASYGVKPSAAEKYSPEEIRLMEKFGVDPETGKVRSK